jgi:hypothetical protein
MKYLFYALISMAAEWRLGGLSVKLTTQLHVMPSLRMSGAKPPLPRTNSFLCAIDHVIYLFNDTFSVTRTTIAENERMINK